MVNTTNLFLPSLTIRIDKLVRLCSPNILVFGKAGAHHSRAPKIYILRLWCLATLSNDTQNKGKIVTLCNIDGMLRVVKVIVVMLIVFMLIVVVVTYMLRRMAIC
jgi:hypothetical protein